MCVAHQEMHITWMGACMPTPWMLIWTIVWKKTKCFSSLTETHACNPSCLITTFDSFLKPSPPPASISLCAESVAYKKITVTLLSPSLQPSLPLLQFLPLHTGAPSQALHCFLSLWSYPLLPIPFVTISIPCHLTVRICMLFFPLTIQICINFLHL